MPSQCLPLDAQKIPHTFFEDVVALIIGTLVISFGVNLLRQTGALTGGTAGMAFLLHYMTGVRFGIVFFLLNLPFAYLALRRMGKAFVFKTFCAVVLVSVFSELHAQFVSISAIDAFYACLFGNAVMGLGFIVLFRHRASLGGVNILALYLQEKHGMRAGKLQMLVDIVVLLISLAWVPLPVLIGSVGGALVLNTIIAMNHRPNRYLA